MMDDCMDRRAVRAVMEASAMQKMDEVAEEGTFGRRDLMVG